MLELKGKPVAENVYDLMANNIKALGTKPHLVVVLVGENAASQVYVSHKQKACETLGFKSSLIQLQANTTELQLKQEIEKLNLDISVNAILLQLPLPEHLNSKKMSELINVNKDADSLTTGSLGLLMAGQHKVASCTPSGIIEILKFYKLSVTGKNVLIIGRSLIVGLPLFHLLTSENATVTLAHSKTENLFELIKQFEFVFVAIGKPHYFKATDFKKDAVVIDVGIHRVPQAGGKTHIIGDVDSVDGAGHLKALTPVPGGVGPMTIAMLMKNTLVLTQAQKSNV